MTSASGPLRNWHQIAAEMLMTDAELALASVDLLLAADDRDAVARVVRNARDTCDSACERRQTTRLSRSDAVELDDRMDRLRARLKFLGEVFQGPREIVAGSAE